mgnify:CR=1 FL=1
MIPTRKLLELVEGGQRVTAKYSFRKVSRDNTSSEARNGLESYGHKALADSGEVFKRLSELIQKNGRIIEENGFFTKYEVDTGIPLLKKMIVIVRKEHNNGR